MIHYPLHCPVCGKEFDSLDSVGDTQQMVDNHVEKEHGNV